MRRWGIIAALVVAGLLVSGTAAASPGYEPGVSSMGWRELDAVLDAADLPRDVKIFLTAVARRESGFSPSAHNESSGEVGASRRGTEGALARGYFANNPYVSRIAAFGSGGWFGFLAPTGLATGGPNGPFANDPPEMVMDPVASVVMALDYIDSLRKKDAFRQIPTWRIINRGWAAPALMGKDTDRALQADARLRKNLTRINHPESFADKQAVWFDYPGPRAMLERIRANLEVA